MSSGSKSTIRTKAVDGRGALQTKKESEKHHISSSYADVRREIFTKFCMVIEVVRAIIVVLKLFWLPSIVLPLWDVENLAKIDPIEVNC